MAAKRVFDLKSNDDNSYSAGICVPYESLLKCLDLMSDCNPLLGMGVVPGFLIDAIAASAFETSMAGSGRPKSIVSMSSEFEQILMADSAARLAFIQSNVTRADIFAENGGRKLGSVSIGYGEPLDSVADEKSFCGMQGRVDYAFSKDDLAEFAKMTGGAPHARYLAPMLALSLLSSAAVLVTSESSGYEEFQPRLRKAGPFEIMQYELCPSLQQSMSPAEEKIAELSAVARECFEKGGIVYTSHSATFFSAAYKMVPQANSEKMCTPFRLYIDCSGLTAVRSKDGKTAGIRGRIKGEATLENNERVFECTASILAKNKRLEKLERLNR